MIIGLVGTLVFTTSAYFSDTEVSSNNTFSTGSVDLKVDSQSHYNGLTCVSGKWVNTCSPVGNDLLINGDFEAPIVTEVQKWQVFANETANLGWTVEWATNWNSYQNITRPEPALQELHRGVNGWIPQHGNQYAELDSDWFGPSNNLNGEPALVKISQMVATMPGTKYQLMYYFSPRPGTGVDENVLDVYVDGSNVDHQQTAGGSQAVWTQYVINFTATGSTTKVEFVGGGTNNSLGIFLDNVSVRAMECSSTMDELEGQSCGGSWALSDLGPESQLFNFSDVKPGDFGENTVSLHVSSNPAYACMFLGSLQDQENDLIDPEIEANDTTSEQGELSANLTVFVWKDDGDNIWEPKAEEKQLYGPAAFNDVFNDRGFTLFDSDSGPLDPQDTAYLGIAWCAGSMSTEGDVLTCNGQPMGNNTQTDSLTADVGFYVEQSRNNQDFSCPVGFFRQATD